MGIDIERLLLRAKEMAEACRGAEGNPGLELGLALGEGWREGRDKVCIPEHESGFALWAEQLIAESTGKQGKGLVPAPGEHPGDMDRQAVELQAGEPLRAGAGVLPLGVRHRRRRRADGDQSLRPAERAGGQGPH